MRVPALVVLTCLLLLPAIARAMPLTIMAEDASEPFSRRDGTGYANDLVRAAFKAAGVEVRLDVVPYARCKNSVEEGSTPACFAMSWLPELRGRVVFADQPLFEANADVFVKRGGPKVSRMDDLRKGAMLGVVNGYEYPDGLYALERRGVVLENNVNEDANLKMLAGGRIDAALVMTNAFEDAARRLKLAGMMKSVAFAFRIQTLQSYIGFSLANPQGPEARRAFNRGYAIIMADGAGERIREHWMNQVQRQDKATR